MATWDWPCSLARFWPDLTTAAPFYHDVALGPADARALWVTASDRVRLRVGLWPSGAKGTVLLFPGRTEYVEKYGLLAGDLNAMGYAVAAIDWRGQGLADRDLPDRNTGHIGEFSDYQLDVAAMLDCLAAQGLPEPHYLIAHSMGGCIGLRALMRGLDVRAAVFSAPMWGIAISGLMRPVAWSMSWVAHALGLGHHYVPGTKPETYVNQFPFEDNLLTTDPQQFAYMQNQLAAHPDLALGGPSLNWLYKALLETRDMAEEPAPDVPALTFLGSNERIVDVAPVHARMSGWPNGKLVMVEGAEHEVLLEVPQRRDAILAGIRDHFAAHP